MQFSVIVAAGNRSLHTEGDRWDELVRYLQSARIRPELITRLRAGKPQVLKNQLSYEQAVTLSDRLADLGLDTTIDPPTKHEARPVQKRSSATRPGTTSRHATSAGNPPRRSTQEAGNGRPAPGKSANTPGKRPLSNHSVAAASDYIKSLFKLPPKGDLQVKRPVAARLRLWFSCLRSLLNPATLVSGLIIMLLAVSGGLWVLRGALTDLSPLLGTLFLPVPVLAMLASLGFIALLVWPRKSRPPARLSVKTKEDPQLVVLVAAICKLLNAPVPAGIYLTPEPELRARLRSSPGQLLALRKPLAPQVDLYLGMPLVAALSISELGALIARECGRYGPETDRRPYGLMTAVAMGLRSYGSARIDRIQEFRAKLSTQGVGGVLRKLLSLVEGLEELRIRSVRAQEARITRRLSERDPIANGYQGLVFGSEQRMLREKIRSVEAAWLEALQDMLQRTSSEPLVDSLSSYVGSRTLPSNTSAKPTAPAATGVLRSDRPAHSLVSEFSRRDTLITRSVYQAHGLDLSRLMPLDALQRRQDNQARLRAVARDYFVGWFHPSQFWDLPAESELVVSDRRQQIQKLEQCIAQLRNLLPDRPQALSRYERLRKQFVELSAAKKITLAGVRFRYQHNGENPSDPGRETSLLEPKLREKGEELRHQNRLMGERLCRALSLDTANRATGGRILTTLREFSRIAQRAGKLATDLEELAIVQSYLTKDAPKNLELHARELTAKIANDYAVIARRLQHCPYGFYDRRFPTLHDLLQQRLQSVNAQLAQDKARTLLALLSEAHEHCSQMAAGYAARLEAANGVRGVKRI
ncbi:hypothetical protein ACXYTJ_02085 [Gilvimarinus sp. F26214L]|uniref:hypothetical protein n=1 Tax=Gilvimarinus sp. DZF01 TaxID=3461371 RepID=UPI004045BEB0